MLDNIDIDDLLNEVAKFRQHIGEVHSRLTHPQERELLSDVIEKIDETRFKVKDQFTDAVAAMEKGLDQAQSEAQANLAKTAQLREQMQGLIKAQAEADAAEPPAAAEPAFDFQLGERLSREMSAQFDERQATAPADKIVDREIWQDWSWKAGEKN
jgi:hypothetical protein